MEPPLRAHTLGVKYMKVEVNLTLLDLFRYNLYVFFTRKLYISYWLILWLLLFLFGGADKADLIPRILVTTLVTLGCLLIGWTGSLVLLVFRSKKGRDYGWRKLEIDENAIYEETKESKSETNWAGVINITKTKNIIYVFVAHSTAYLIPKKAFIEQEGFENFYNEANIYFSRNT